MKTINLIIGMMLLLPAVALTSCSDDEPKGNEAKPRVDIVLTRSEKAVNAAATSFGIKMINPINKYAQEKGLDNWTMSPLSASEVLGIMANGANGETLEQICDLLGVDSENLADVNSYYKNIKSQLFEVDNTAKINIANALYFDDEYSVLSDFEQTCKDYFNAPVCIADFDAESTWTEMNKWVSEQTNSIIENEPRKPEEYVRIMNAMYFKGFWKSKFNNAYSDRFYPNYPETAYFVNVKIMKKLAKYGYARSEHFEACEIPYGNEAFSMVVMLPLDDVTLDEQLEKLTYEEYDYLMNDFDVHKLEIYLPKWEAKSRINLSKVISDMPEYKDIFDLTGDYSKMSNDKIIVNSSVQNTYIKVDETGTEVASTTTSNNMDIAPLPEIDYVFKCDRPFFYLVKEKSTGVILLMGKVSKL